MTLQTRVLLWMCVLVGVNQLGFGAMIPSLPLYAQSFGVPASAIGMAVAAYGLARFFTAVPAGQLSDGLGRSTTLAIGGLISAAGNIWCAFATSYPEFIVARFVAGAGAGLIVTTGQIVLADITQPAERGRVLAMYQGTFIFAVGIGPFPGGLLAEHFGLKAPFISYGIAAMIVTALAWFGVPETRNLFDGAGAGQKASPRVSLATQARQLLSQRGFAMISVIALTAAMVRTGGMFSIVPVLAKEKLDISVSAIGFSMMLGSVSGLIAAYPIGWLTDRFGRRTVIVPATLMTGGAMLLFCFAPNYAWFTGASIAWGIAQSASGTAPAAYAADSAPRGSIASALGIYRMLSDAGYVLGPLLLGIVVDHFGATPALLLASAMIMLAGAVFGLFAPESYRAKGAAEQT